MNKIISILLVIAFVPVLAGCEPKQENTIGSGSESLSESIAQEETSKSTDISELTEEPQKDESSSMEEEPDNDWQFDTPENHGVDSDMLEKFHNAISDVEIRSAIIIKDGFIIDEYYKDGYDETYVFGLASCTKSFTGALIGIAIDNGLISDTNAKLPKYFPQLSDDEDADKQDITIENLLTHTSGLYWNEWAGGDYFMKFSRSENWVDFVLGQNMAEKPGALFSYSTGGSHLLSAVIQEAAGITEYEFGMKYLFTPLGMDTVKWRSDPQDITDGGNGISMTVRDAAKFGQLYLDGGKWRGRQIIPEEWVRLSTEPQAAGSPGTGEYGYSWWLKPFGGYNAYYAMGHGGQYIFVVPELNLVTVVTSRLSDTYAPQYYFNDYIIPACG